MGTKALTKGPIKAVSLTLLGLAIAAVEFAYNGLGELAYNVAGFGTEYGNTAASLVRGEGYANPFGFPSGPSAWMPPGIVLIYALVFQIFGIKTYAAGLALLTLRAAVLTAAVWALSEAATLLRKHAGRPLAVIPLSALAMFGHFHWLSQRCTDQFVIILASALTVLCLVQIRHRTPRRWHLVLAFSLPLTAPSIGLGLGLVLLWQSFKGSRAAQALLLTTLLSIAFWSARNVATMGSPFLIKSNAGFEFFLSNECSRSGLMSSEILFHHHPLQPQNPSSEEIKALGEAEFCRLYRHRAIAYTKEHPREVLSKVFQRAVNAFVFCRFGKAQSTGQRIRGLLYASLPVGLLLIGLLRGGWRIPSFRQAMVLYIAYFLPYILISNYERYQLGAIGLQVWVVWLTTFSGLLEREPSQG